MKSEVELQELSQVDLEDSKQSQSDLAENYIELSISEDYYSLEEPELLTEEPMSPVSFVEIDSDEEQDEKINPISSTDATSQEEQFDPTEFNQGVNDRIQEMVARDRSRAERSSYSGGIVASFWSRENSQGSQATTTGATVISENSDCRL